MEAIGLFAIIFIALSAFILLQNIVIRNEQKTIQVQQETIQKLLNREPVTYKEVNVQPPKIDTDRPIAWGGTIANRDEL